MAPVVQMTARAMVARIAFFMVPPVAMAVWAAVAASMMHHAVSVTCLKLAKVGVQHKYIPVLGAERLCSTSLTSPPLGQPPELVGSRSAVISYSNGKAHTGNWTHTRSRYVRRQDY